MRVPWTARRSNQSILKVNNPEYSLEGLMMKLKSQYFGPPDAKSQLIRKDPNAGKDLRQEEKGTTEDNASKKISSLKKALNTWLNTPCPREDIIMETKIFN